MNQSNGVVHKEEENKVEEEPLDSNEFKRRESEIDNSEKLKQDQLILEDEQEYYHNMRQQPVLLYLLIFPESRTI